MYYDYQQKLTYTEQQRRKIKEYFDKHEFQNLRQYNKVSDYDLPVFPKTVIRQILSSMRNEDGYQCYMLMGFMNKFIQEKINKLSELKYLDEQKYEKDRFCELSYGTYINAIKQMKWFHDNDFDFKTTMYIRDQKGNIVHKMPKKLYQFKSKYYQGDQELKNNSFRYYESLFYDDALGYKHFQEIRNNRLAQENLKLQEGFDNGKSILEDEFEREERLYEFDYPHHNETESNIKETQKAEMIFQEKLFHVYRILFGNPSQYTLNQRKKHFVLMVTYFLYDPNDKLLNEKMVPYYCIFSEHLEYQTIIEPLDSRNYLTYRDLNEYPIQATYNKMIFQLEEFLKKNPGFENSFNFQQNYSMLLFKTRAYDKCIDFIVKTGMPKLPSSIYYSFNSQSEHDCLSFSLKEFWYPLFQRINCDQLEYMSYQVARAAFDRNEVLQLRFYNTLYNLVHNTNQSAEIVHKVGNVRYTPDREEFIQHNWKAIGINPKCSSAHNSLAKFYIEKNKPELYLQVMESFCEFKSNELLLLEGIEKFFSQFSLQQLSKCVALYRQSSYLTIHRGINKLFVNLKQKFNQQQLIGAQQKLDFFKCRFKLETTYLQYILLCLAYKKQICQLLIYKQDFQHFDLSIE
ncbi:hypothetical protein TTHERM_00765180 (macronuclear) [Tetrahymena thermophila SB210]|uniref:Uncharacterized protein n=1 Tax=Tetrahymena thermophila (strain SB210) TaxID=312017 RepID=I7MJ58_TETTS|nr:hypothetical protein TTHERM_00765180 [Tetrahymena thermophila SB210]EAS05132.2 hypothetical protein TTHERM_00765180 [Tetrahymena thermophila SB210]|eukprot:XP_001025377.2 hypothetical protein TTHERM_00765180 [Tetrahymena thermophila SB210]